MIAHSFREKRHSPHITQWTRVHTIFYTTNEIVMITKKLISRYRSLFVVRNLTDAIPGTGNKMVTVVASFTFCYIRSRRHEQDPGNEVELAVGLRLRLRLRLRR